MPQIPSGAVGNLSHFLGLSSLMEYAMLNACQRDDIIKFGCDPQFVNWAGRVALHKLEQLGYVYRDSGTRHWELTSLGRTALNIVPDVVHVPIERHGLAEVIEFPSSRLTPNDAVADTVKHS